MRSPSNSFVKKESCFKRITSASPYRRSINNSNLIHLKNTCNLPLMKSINNISLDISKMTSNINSIAKRNITLESNNCIHKMSFNNQNKNSVLSISNINNFVDKSNYIEYNNISKSKNLSNNINNNCSNNNKNNNILLNNLDKIIENNYVSNKNKNNKMLNEINNLINDKNKFINKNRKCANSIKNIDINIDKNSIFDYNVIKNKINYSDLSYNIKDLIKLQKTNNKFLTENNINKKQTNKFKQGDIINNSSIVVNQNYKKCNYSIANSIKPLNNKSIINKNSFNDLTKDPFYSPIKLITKKQKFGLKDLEYISNNKHRNEYFKTGNMKIDTLYNTDNVDDYRKEFVLK